MSEDRAAVRSKGKQRQTPASEEQDEKPRKRSRTNAGLPATSGSQFKDLFGPQASVPLNTAVNDSSFALAHIDPTSIPPPIHTYITLPPDQWTYGPTPALTVKEQAIADLNQRSIPPSTDPSESSLPNAGLEDIASSPVSSGFPPIDPALSSPTADLIIPDLSRSNSPQPINTLDTARKSLSPLTSFAPFSKKAKFTSPSLQRRSMSPFVPFASSSKSTSAPPTTSEMSPTLVSSPLTPTTLHFSAPLIPKAVTDRLAAHDSRLSDIEAATHRQEDKLNKTIQMHADIMKAIDNEQTVAGQRIDMLEGLVKKQGELIEQLLAAGSNGGVPEKVEKKVSTTKKRNNPLNNTIRRCLFLAMGLPVNSVLRTAAAVKPTIAGGGYIKDPETKGQMKRGKLLRPDWQASWTENSSWHDPMVKFVRSKSSSVVPGLDISQTTDDDILARLEVVFRNVGAEYRKATKAAAEDADTEGEDFDGGNAAQANRRRGRKVRKCEERTATIEENDIDIPEDWAFFLQPVYQSTDESDPAEVLDPDTDTEVKGEVPAKSTRKPWVTRAPLYRTPEFHAGVLHIDEALMQRRHKFAKDNRGKTGAHDRVRGAAKDTPLPFIKSHKAQKIRRAAIDSAWLLTHEAQDTPSRIYQTDDEMDNGTENPEAEVADDEELGDSDSDE